MQDVIIETDNLFTTGVVALDSPWEDLTGMEWAIEDLDENLDLVREWGYDESYLQRWNTFYTGTLTVNLS